MTDSSYYPLSIPTISSLVQAQFTSGFLPNDTAKIQAAIDSFMAKFKVPGLSFAITQGGRLVYAKGFGVARKRNYFDVLLRRPPEKVDVWTRFRIASVTKPITSAAIFTLVEKRQLSLNDTVFGPSGIFGNDFGFSSLTSAQMPGVLMSITVQNLLEHTTGGWPNDVQDPMFVQPTLGKSQLIEWVLRNRPLDHSPGTVFSYSNFGYCLLGRVIEKVTGQPYSDYVEASILRPCGVGTMEIGGDTLADRRPGEAVYYGQPYYVTYSIGGSIIGLKQEDDPYAIPLARMDSHGGWIGSAVDLVRFAVHVDGFPAPPDILSSASLSTMSTPTNARRIDGSAANYGKGWSLFQNTTQNNWFHTGSLPGSLSLLVRSSNGFCWAALMNTRQAGDTMLNELDQNTLWPIFDGPTSVKSWPSHDLFSLYDDPWRLFRL